MNAKGTRPMERAVALRQDHLVLGRYRPLRPLGSGGRARSGSFGTSGPLATSRSKSSLEKARPGRARSVRWRRRPGCATRAACGRSRSSATTVTSTSPTSTWPGKTLRQALPPRGARRRCRRRGGGAGPRGPRPRTREGRRPPRREARQRHARGLRGASRCACSTSGSRSSRRRTRSRPSATFPERSPTSPPSGSRAAKRPAPPDVWSGRRAPLGGARRPAPLLELLAAGDREAREGGRAAARDAPARLAPPADRPVDGMLEPAPRAAAERQGRRDSPALGLERGHGAAPRDHVRTRLAERAGPAALAALYAGGRVAAALLPRRLAVPSRPRWPRSRRCSARRRPRIRARHAGPAARKPLARPRARLLRVRRRSGSSPSGATRVGLLFLLGPASPQLQALPLLTVALSETRGLGSCARRPRRRRRVVAGLARDPHRRGRAE